MNSQSPEARSPSRARLKMSGAVWLWAAGVPAVAVAADQLLQRTDLPLVLRALLALTPLVPGAMFLRAQARALERADELALRIANEAFAFVFYALIGIFICVDLLENSGVLPGFTWNTLRLTIAMFVLMMIGTVVSSRRYR